MALDSFSTSNYLSVASAPVTAAPLSISTLGYVTSTAATGVFVSIAATATVHKFELRYNTSAQIAAGAQDGGGSSSSQSATFSTNTWIQAGHETGGATDRTAVLDGVRGVTNSTSRTPASVARTALGVRADSSFPSTPLAGRMCETAIWNVALSDGQWAALGAKLSPLFFPVGLVTYWRGIRVGYGDTQNVLTGSTLTTTGTLTTADHPRIIYPTPAYLAGPANQPQRLRVSMDVSSLGLRSYIFNWSADNLGNVDQWAKLPRETPPTGRLYRLITVPSPGSAPSDNYDLTLCDRWGNDLLQGLGANRDATAVESAWVSDSLTTAHWAEVATLGMLRFRVANAGPYGAGVAALQVLPV